MPPGVNKRRTRHLRRPARREAGATERAILQTVKIVYWEDDGAWLGYLQDYPDYWTQGKTLEDLKEHLKDLYKDITSGEIPGIRRVDDLVIS
jgi:hypothetical protein